MKMENEKIYGQTTICARATAPGQGAVAIVRVSGPEAVDVLDKVFRPFKDKGPRAAEFRPKEMHYGRIIFPESPGHSTDNAETVIDEVMAVTFRAPHSYTGEDSAEIYCHGSQYIVSEILRALLAAGAVMAAAGEFTKRAFLNGRMDLAQAEAVADLIASENRAAHDIALKQMRGGYSSELQEMRSQMVDIVSLMELELDFSEEDVEFADRTRVLDLIDRVSAHISRLADSFALGNAIKNGIPVAIVGAVNTGKSTLLNEDRAIVSDIAGTTRDTIEDTVNIAGTTFRFIDTAGIRETSDSIETIGINRTYTTLSKAALILLMLDATRPGTFPDSLAAVASRISPGQRLFVLLNKADLLCGDGIAPTPSPSDSELYDPAVEHPDRTGQPVTAPVQDYASLAALPAVRSMLTLIEDIARQAGLTTGRIIPLSARCRLGLPEVTSTLTATAADFSAPASATLVTNLRHYQALREALTALTRSREALTAGVSTEFVTQDIREALYHIGTICGQVTSDEILGAIFSRFCIGK